ncbi:MAG: hypothetical protein ACUVSX_02355 [Aggregatilineales bacterium]
MNTHSGTSVDRDAPASQPPAEGDVSKRKQQAELNKLTHQIAQKLGETEQKPIRQIGIIVRHFGAEAALALLAETEAIEAQGGMMIANGRRRRTPGGVFFYLAKERMTPEEREQLLPSRYIRIKQYRAMLREQEEKANLPTFVWETRHAAIAPALAEQGEVSSVRITMVGRPGKVELFRDMVVTAMAHTGKFPTFPRGVPAPPETPTVYTVYMSSAHWHKVKQSIENEPEDMLIVEGFCAYDEAVGAMAVYAISVTSKKLEAAKRRAEKQAIQAAGGARAAPKQTAKPAAPHKPAAKPAAPHKPAAKPAVPHKPAAKPAPEREKAQPAKPSTPAASSPAQPPIANAMSPADAQKLRELHALAELFRQKIAAIEAKPEGERFGLEMTRKLLRNVEADIAALKRKHGA